MESTFDIKDLIMFLGFMGTIIGATWKMSGVVNSLKEQIIILQQEVKTFVTNSNKMEKRIEKVEEDIESLKLDLAKKSASHQKNVTLIREDRPA